MALFGPPKKSVELRVLEGNRSHRPLPPAAPRCLTGVPECPKGMTAGARRVWAGYIEQLATLNVLRPVDGFALRRLCEDVAMLQELQAGARKLARDMRRAAKTEGRKIPGGAMIELATSPEGRRLAATVNALASRIKRDELQFGLTPVASERLQGIMVPCVPELVAGRDAKEVALCGPDDEVEPTK